MMNYNLYFENHHTGMIGPEHKYTLYVAFADDPQRRVIGYLSYTVWNDELYVDYVEVKEEHRGKGIGKALYKKLYELNQECKFKRAGFYTESGSHIREWFEKEILGIQTV
jgi:ribosomal protein S18 acetylase RimI-like enzyme